MAATSNAFALLNDGDQAGLSVSKASKKKSKSKAKKKAVNEVNPGKGEGAPPQELVTPSEAVPVASPDGFRPAGRSSFKQGRPNNGRATPKPAEVNAKPVAVAEESICSACSAASPQRVEAWEGLTQQVASQDLYLTLQGNKLSFREVLLGSAALDELLSGTLLNPLDSDEQMALLRLVGSLFIVPPDVPQHLVALLADMGASLRGATPELVGLAGEAIAALGAALRAVAGSSGAATAEAAATVVAAEEQVVALEEALAKAPSVREQAALCGRLLEALEVQLDAAQSGGWGAAQLMLPAERFLAVLHARIHEGPLSGSKQQTSQLLIGLQHEEAMLIQQAAGLQTQIQALEVQLAALRRQTADVEIKLKQNRQRCKAIFQPLESEDAACKQAEEAAVMHGLQRVMGSLQQATGSAGVTHATNGTPDAVDAGMAYLQSVERLLAASLRHQAELCERVKFLHDRLLAAKQQAQHLKFLNMGADALERQAKTAEQRRIQLQEALQSLTVVKSTAQTAFINLTARADMLKQLLPPSAYSAAVQRANDLLQCLLEAHEHAAARAAADAAA